MATITTPAKTPTVESSLTVVITACVMTCIAVASVYLTQPVLADIAAAHHVSISDARLAFSATSIAYALAFFVLGPLSDRMGLRRMAGLGALLAALSLLVAAMLNNYTWFLVACTVQGAAAAAIPAAMFALMPRIARKDQVGMYFGLIIAATVVGITLGRSAMGLLTAHLGLQGALLACGAALLCMVGVAFFLPNQTVVVQPKGHANRDVAGLLQIYVDTARMLMAPNLLRLFATGFALFFGYLGVVTFLTLRLHEVPFMFNSATIGSISLLGLGAVQRPSQGV